MAKGGAHQDAEIMTVGLIEAMGSVILQAPRPSALGVQASWRAV